MNSQAPLTAVATEVAPRTKPSNYPEPFATRMSRRQKRQLGDVFRLKSFGVNLTRLEPGGESALMHVHSKQDEFILVLEGNPTMVTDQGEVLLRPGMCAGFAAGSVAHHLVNRSDREVVILEVGDRAAHDEVSYPQDDLVAALTSDGTWRFTHKDGRPY